MTDCIFCKIIKGEMSCNKIYEDDKVLAFLDRAPVNKGHTLVVPKEHYEDIQTIPENLLCGVISAVKKIAPVVIKVMGADSFNLSVNNGREAGQVISHLHFHIMPRFKNDGLEPWPSKIYQDKEAEEITNKIRNLLDN